MVANTAVLVRWVAWALLIGGVLLGGSAYLSRPTQAVSPVRVAAANVSDSGTSLGPAGFAQLYVAAYIEAGEGSQKALAAFYPAAAQVSLSGKAGEQRAEQTAAVRFTTVAPGYWSVIVAARVTGPTVAADPAVEPPNPTGAGSSGLRYFQVAVRATGAAGQGGYVAVALPAEVSEPGHGGAPSLDYGPSVPAQAADLAVQTLQAFLGAYLTGAGELDRYLSPGTQLAPVTPAPYTAVTVAQVAEHAGATAPNTAQAPADGAVRRLLVDTAATTGSGQQRPLTYAVVLKARAGRWEVAAIDAAPDLATGATPTAAATSPAATSTGEGQG
ncbi:Conjugative transposon protein TcpC [Actinacidiphila rubida]|uniref:Conjugative transposon protein TcpC n=1 Tax=Actinacidiphila rubida TaxID=310780 RepID=A0A1H8TGI3_9ACTN|nr:Conjugative transposon protein TcpC [Actinacidiphila rubida]